MHYRQKALNLFFLELNSTGFHFSQRSDVEESPASVYETDEEESDTVSTCSVLRGVPKEGPGVPVTKGVPVTGH